MTASGRIGVGLIGYGLAGKIIHAPLIANTAGVELVAAASSRPDEVMRDLPGIATYTDPDRLIDAAEVDLVVVATPNDTHASWAKAALAAEKHVLVEKPFALSLDEARDVLAAAARSTKQLFVFQNRRFDSDFMTVRKVVESGALGEIVVLESAIERFTPEVQTSWRHPARRGSGIWYDLGPHLVDQVLLLFGKPDSVTASFARMRPAVDTEDWAEVILAYGTMRIILRLSFVAAGHRTRFRVHGTAGSAIKTAADRQGPQYLAGLSPGDPAWGIDPDPLVLVDAAGEQTVVEPERGDHRRLYAQVVQAIMDGGDNPTPPGVILDVMAIIEAAHTSAREGRTIAMA